MKLGGRLGKYLSGDQGGLRVARGLVLLLGTLAYFGARCNVIVGSFAEGALQGFHRVGVEADHVVDAEDANTISRPRF